MTRALTALLLCSALTAPAAAAEPTVAELQRQIDELKAMVQELKAAQRGTAAAAPPITAAAPPPAPAREVAATPPAPAVQQAAAHVPSPKGKAWYERLTLRGYTQMRLNEIVSGDRTAPAGLSRLRSVQDSGISDQNNFSLRRVRLVLQGDLGDNVSLYLQPDFATAVSNQSANERREGFGQLRDAYVDLHWGKADEFRLRFGQSKVPFGWENLQSSSNRLALDRTDAINSATPGERDLGVVAYYTPAHVARIWKRLGDDGQKLFGNYGAFGLALYNGQGIGRTETNNNLMTVAMATWPFELDGLGSAFEGQVIEVGGSGMLNKYQPELRSGGVSPVAFDDNRVVVHAMLYPQPFGIQAEWTWGRGPEFDQPTNRIATKSLNGGYIQSMFRVKDSPIGAFMPFARWQYYRGGFKSGLNAPRLETDEIEFGVEFQPIKPIEFTLSYSHMKRREADERRSGQAEGDLIRAQVQFNY
ncbi:porin [Sandarakinorhabdus sp. DWP1-3-1]|uniref:porin n=1 Tax=Sandarakinorhabdus sp. DWP1-3-1 TaxID=2804627 RepID=UPI003CF54B12